MIWAIMMELICLKWIVLAEVAVHGLGYDLLGLRLLARFMTSCAGASISMAMR